MSTKPTARSRSTAFETVGRRLLAAPIDPLTYRSLAYLLLAFPLAVGYFVVLVTGASLTIGLSITLLGPVMGLMTVLAIVGLSWLDGTLTRVLLDADVTPHVPSTDQGAVPFVKELLLSRHTWLGAAYLVWKIALGFVAFVGVVVGVTLATSLLLVPLFYGNHLVIDYGLGAYSIETITQAIGVATGGLVLGYLTLVMVNLGGQLSAFVAERLLGSTA